MNLTISYISEMFDWFNQEHFDGTLKKPIFKITHVKTYLGQYHYKYYGTKLIESVISISDYYDRTEDDVCNTLIHEMIHLYIRQNRIKDTRPHHGRVFNSIADRINKEGNWHIARTDSVEGCGLRDKSKVSTYYVGLYKNGRCGRYFSFSMNENYMEYYKCVFKAYPTYYVNPIIIKSSDDKLFAHYPKCRSSVRGHYISDEKYKTIVDSSETIYKSVNKAA